ncbi:protein jagged-2-like [Pollicipes pollicipes]|uniref:protein jagged-2-like n=1 Tax=Pollicipes pollicipes TaxID=41117 RepID=UPI0018858C82|nr:protein jagged-2-like [Pollicipes pollicipes]
MRRDISVTMWTVMLLGLCIGQVAGSGFFELQVLETQNYRGERLDGRCCGTAGRTDGRCQAACHTSFRLCLKEYQSHIHTQGSCSFGNTTSTVVGGNSFTLTDPANATLRLPFTFSWMRYFTLILEALDNVGGQQATEVIEQTSYSGIIRPSSAWHTLTHNGNAAKITYRIRVQCDDNYFNSTCTKLCRPRDDQFGHYTCNSNGDKVCRDGWMGTNCETAICKKGCHPVNGHCDRPQECRCEPGWRGEFCDECLPYPGCKHGFCNGKPWLCNCELNWGGILCEQDLNYCGTHEPCVNGGTCENTRPDEYRCTCPEGFSGDNCQVVDNPCATGPCQHGGTCIDMSGDFQCSCPSGWSGERCQINVNECESLPCMHGGTCEDLVDGFKCTCPHGWEGNACQLDSDECRGSPCLNAVSCKNLVGDYECQCMEGWTGKNCDQAISNCGSQCHNGGTCIDLAQDYRCICQSGYTGRNCEENINECQPNPCLNGGECVDLIGGFRCICPVGYTGVKCETDVDLCNPNPCENGAFCFNTNSDYFCDCPEGLHGKNCSETKAVCLGPQCNVDSCMISSSAGGGQRSASRHVTICGEHGRCLSAAGGQFSCACDPGYTGGYCHQNINDCSSDPCHNGATCIDGINSFTCICPLGWEGPLCNTNKNECEPNPCRHNGSCVDAVADYACACPETRKGKRCHLTDSHCDLTTCLNGGTCRDLGSTFLCHCTDDWEGTVCQLRKNPACSTSPCLNGATCVNTGDTYSCICREGYEGRRCEHDINDCNPHPCYNGGSCVDGINWFSCECPRGFLGPDCRINVDECASSPCTFGSTCVDAVGGYTCICPPGRAGSRCSEVVDAPVSGASCFWRGSHYSDGDTWRHSCNTCRCQNGLVTCTKLWCGAGNCIESINDVLTLSECGPSQVCVRAPSESCLAPPCAPLGECRKLGVGKTVGPPISPAPTSCWPNQAFLSNSCAKLRVRFDTARLAVGSTVESLCGQLRRLLVDRLADSLTAEALVVMCDLAAGEAATLAVTLSTPRSAEVSAISPLVTETAQRLGDLLSSGHGSLPVAAAVTEVHTETSARAEPAAGGPLLTVVCTLVAVLVLAASLLLLAWQQRRRARRLRDDALRKEENCNNVQNEKNLRRYRNRLDSDEPECRAGCTSDAYRDGYKLKELDMPSGGAAAAAAAKRRDSLDSVELRLDSPRAEKPALYKPVNVNNLAPPRGAGPSKEINKEILRDAAQRQPAPSRTLSEDSPELHEVLV